MSSTLEPRFHAEQAFGHKIILSTALLAIGVAAACSGVDGGTGTPNPSGGYSSGLSLTNAIDLDATGPIGGPFDPPASYTLSNIGSQALNWTATASEPWIQLSDTAGFLQTGESMTLTATVGGSAAANLTEGAYSGAITFSDTADSDADIVRPVFLAVLGQQTDIIDISPSNGLSASGEVGGPFSPGSMTYTLTNSNSFDYDWGISFSDPWVESAGPTSGTLTPGASTDVTVQLNTALVAALPAGLHSATVTFLNLGDSATPFAFRPVVLLAQTTVDGWTEFTPSADTRIIYVSNSGSNSNDGLSPATPKQSIAAGLALLRDGFPDWLMLERGSTFNESLGTWRISGRSPSEKMVVQDYGNPASRRPTITGVGTGINFHNEGCSHVAVVSIRFVGLTDTTAIDGHASMSDILIENCLVDAANMSFQTPIGGTPPTDIQLRRNVIMNSGPIGLFANETQNMLVEECIFYNNGLSDDTRAHNMYFSGNNGPNAESGRGFDSRGNIIRSCIILHAAGNLGIKFRAQFDGIIERNVFSRNRIGVDVHTKWANEYSTNHVIRENVMFDQGNPANPAISRGFEINGAHDVVIEGNIVTGNPLTLGGGHAAFRIGMPQYDTNNQYAGLFFPSCENVTIRNNIVYGWNGNGVDFTGAQNMVTNNYRNIQVIDNEFQNVSPDTGIVRRLVNFSQTARFGANGASFSGNQYWSMWDADDWYRTPSNMTYTDWLAMSSETGSTSNELTYTDPIRNFATYSATLGIGNSFQDYVDVVLLQEKGNWDEDLAALAVINYIRDGFDLAPLQ